MNADSLPPVEDPLLLFQEGAAILEVELSQEALPQFRFYLQELQTWNSRVNLTGLKSERDIIIKGFLDSLAVLPFLQKVRSLVDIGSGAGFPGLVLKLARPELALTLVESRGKKAAFLEYMVSIWPLSGVEVVQTFLTPESARQWGPRFEAATSRATFALERFFRLAAPLLLPGGQALALKGPKLPAPELQAARGCLDRVGLGTMELREYCLPFTKELRLVSMATKKEI